MARSLFLAALVAALAPAFAQGAPLGRLFYSAHERERMDELRRGDPVKPSGERVGPHMITGYVERSDGHGTVWVDGRPVPISGTAEKRLLDPSGVRGYSHAAPTLRRDDSRR